MSIQYAFDSPAVADPAAKSAPRHVLSLRGFSAHELIDLVRTAIEMKQQPEPYKDALSRKGLLLLFEKTSTRTALSFQSAISQLGGYGVVLDWKQSNFSISPIRHEVAYASRNCDVIMARLRHHTDLVEMATYSQVPVINGCCEKFHPTQALADMMTVYETAGGFEGVTLTYVGVHNNVTNSLLEACLAVGMNLVLVTPIINDASWDQTLMNQAQKSGLVRWSNNLAEAVAHADFVYTDTWIDMEHFDDPAYATERERRIATMLPFQLNRTNLGSATPWVMHDMPIHPGFEIDDELVYSDRSLIYQQAENRLHIEKALLLRLLTG